MLKTKILVVEDERIVALDIKQMLEAAGYVVTALAATGESALQQTAATWPDLVLMDIKLKGEMDGVATAAQIREQFDLPVIYLTAYSDEATLQRAKLTGPYGYLLKPLNERELHTTIQTALYRHQAEVEIRQRNRELTLLNQVITASATSAEPEKFLEIACCELAQAFDLPHAVALVLNEDKTVAMTVAENNSHNPSTLINQSFPIRPDSVVQAILKDKTPLAVSDVENEPRLARTPPLLRQYGVASLLLLPLTVESEAVGLLALGSTRLRDFTQTQLDLARIVADQVGGALSRVRLQQQRSQMSAVIDQTAESVVITDSAGTITYVNSAFEGVTGYSQAEAIGQTPAILKSHKHPPSFYEDLWRTITSGQVWHGQFINSRKDGRHFIEDATITPIKDKDGQIVNYVAVKRDVTRELQLEEQYHQSQKMEAIGLLAGGIAHDFNNLLTAINGFAELLQHQLPADSPQQELVAKILQGGHRAAQLVRQLLAFSRKQVIEPKTLNINDLLRTVEKMLGRLIGEHIGIEIDLLPELWSVHVDPTQFEQIVFNLAINARDAMPDGGKLIIETANVALSAEDVADHFEAQPGRYVALTVSDTGLGMDEETRAHIFEPFFTTKETGKGTGLGLATVYGIVTQNRGFIAVDSQKGQGTTFKVYLPQVEAASVIDDTPQAWTQIQPGTETILLVEDEPEVRSLAARILRKYGYTVLEAANGHEALNLSGKLNGELELLVTDVIMPGLNGKELAEQMQRRRPELKTLFLSGYDGEMIARHGLLEAGIALIQKPFSAATLAGKVRELLGSK